MSGVVVFVVQTAPNAVGLIVLLSLSLSRLPRVVLSLTTAYFVIWLGFMVAYVAEFLGLPSLSLTSVWALLAWGLIPPLVVAWGILVWRSWRRQLFDGALLFLGCMFLLSCVLEIAFSLLEDGLLLNYGAVTSTVAAVLIIVAFIWQVELSKAGESETRSEEEEVLGPYGTEVFGGEVKGET